MYRTQLNPEARTYASDLTTFDAVQALSLDETTEAIATLQAELKTGAYRLQVLKDWQRRLATRGGR